MTGLNSDYTQAVKDYIPEGQNKSLWEQFFMGTQQTYQGLTQQAQDVASYDISEAYANYKKQQLQLQMNEQLGAGFQQQAGGQLQSAYGSAYADIRTKEASNIYDIETQKQAAIEKGEKEFAEQGKKLRTGDKLITEFSILVGKPIPENAYREYTDEAGNVVTELTDYGRLWYNEVLNARTTEGDLSFEQWLMNEDSLSNIDYDDREEFFEFYRNNRDLVLKQVAGLTSDFDAESTRTRLDNEERQAAFTGVVDAGGNSDEFSSLYGENFSKVSPQQAKQIQNNVERNDEYVSTLWDTSGMVDKVVTDSYGNSWTLTTYNYHYDKRTGVDDDKEAFSLGKTLGIIDKKGHVQNTKYSNGDVILHDGKYYVITDLNVNKGRFGYREVRPGDFNYDGAVRRILP